jgi:hypothetical protein
MVGRDSSGVSGMLVAVSRTGCGPTSPPLALFGDADKVSDGNGGIERGWKGGVKSMGGVFRCISMLLEGCVKANVGRSQL